MGIWAGLHQYKAALHVHTTNSDGSVLFADMVEAYYDQDFDLLAITDHNIVTRSWVDPPTTNGLTTPRANEMANGLGRLRPMVMIPAATEQSRSAQPPDHINTFMTDFVSADWPTLFAEVARQDGLAHINHLGRYIGTAPGISRYIELLTSYPHCVGIEMISTHYINNNDRVIWDSLNNAVARPVWGFATDDSHTLAEVGQSYTVLAMPDNTIADFRAAMTSGSFYGVARRAPAEGVTSPTGAPPVITDIEVSAAEITVIAENHTRIDWIGDGQRVADGATLQVGRLPYRVVRANVIGTGGVAFTQPFRIVRPPRESRVEILSRMHLAVAPVAADELVRKADLADISAGVGFFSFEQDSGDLYFIFDLGVREDMFEYDAATGNFYYNLPEA